MFNNARPVSRSHDIVERKYVLTRFCLEKVLSADEVVTGRVAAINSCVYIFGNSSLLHATSASNALHGITRSARLPELGPLFHFCCQRWNSAVRRTSSQELCVQLQISVRVLINKSGNDTGQVTNRFAVTSESRFKFSDQRIKKRNITSSPIVFFIVIGRRVCTMHDAADGWLVEASLAQSVHTGRVLYCHSKCQRNMSLHFDVRHVAGQ